MEVHLGILEFYLKIRKQKSQKLVYNTLSQNKFILPDLFIAMNLSKYEKILCFLYKGKKAHHNSFYENKWFLASRSQEVDLTFLIFFFHFILFFLSF